VSYLFADTLDECLTCSQVHLLSALPVRRYTLRVDLADFEGQTRFAEYSDFTISSAADNYTLQIGAYAGNAGSLVLLLTNIIIGISSLSQYRFVQCILNSFVLLIYRQPSASC